MFRFLTVLLLIVLASSAQAQESDIFEEAKKYSASVYKALKDCDSTTALNITFDDVFDSGPEFRANPKFNLKCVSFDAVASWRRIYRDEMTGYVIAKSGKYKADKTVRQHIGLAGHETMSTLGLRENAVKGKITGVLGTCGFTMGGYCHYESGPYLTLVTVKGQKISSHLRLVGNDAAEKYGNLKELSKSHALSVGLSNFFSDWRNAIGLGDEKSFNWIASLAGYENGDNTQFEDHQGYHSKDEVHGFYRGLWEAFFDNESTYMKLTPGKLGEQKYFQEISSGAEDEPPNYVACLCVIDVCDNRWPISTRDVYVNDNLPYLCVLARKEEGDWRSYLPMESSKGPVREVSTFSK